MVARILQSVLVACGAATLALALSIAWFELYDRYLIAHPPGLGAVAGGIYAYLMFLLILAAFCIGFGWNWRRTRGVRGSSRRRP